MRLQKFLAECGVASRRASEEIIRAGRVQVNGEVAELGAKVNPDSDTILLDGKPVEADKKVYILLNKPVGTVSTAKDTHGRKTVCYILRDAGPRLFPVGRLDIDVEGALLMTNDGELAHRLMHPKFQVDKLYQADVVGEMSDDAAAKMKQGIDLDDGRAVAVDVKILSRGKRSSRVHLTLREGRKREVKRLCEAVGHRVRKLKRLSFAGVAVKSLKPGKWRHLQVDEIAKLRKLAGLSE
jgi:pseudouridine synthase